MAQNGRMQQVPKRAHASKAQNGPPKTGTFNQDPKRAKFVQGPKRAIPKQTSLPRLSSSPCVWFDMPHLGASWLKACEWGQASTPHGNATRLLMTIQKVNMQRRMGPYLQRLHAAPGQGTPGRGTAHSASPQKAIQGMCGRPMMMRPQVR